MSADRETNHDMTQHDIALLLADAADEVEIGIAPTQALIRGGRRRKARRWAVAAATALVVTGSTGALALTGLPGHEDRAAPPATQPAVTGTPTPFQPQGRTTLATGTDGGEEWRVTLDVWPAPVDVQDARSLMNAMAEYGEAPAGVNTPADLVGRSAYFVHRGTGENSIGWEHLTLQGLTAKGDSMSGQDVDAVAVPLAPAGGKPDRLVIGYVAKSVQRVTCAWKDGTTTEVRRVPADADIKSDDLTIRTIEDSPYNWFVCLAPQGTEYKSAEVTQ
ncbi:hypothetical protein ACIBVL_02965 [Streptomyces sp. NPDC049687]|uniref:hypothetical protein n=1 Tax=Streptomyces sp. NPDC049687 TaxID=3365596 RepID=UPI0037B11104